MKLILCGGGDGEQNYYANKKLNEIINHNKPLLYVPLAMDENIYSYDSCYEWINEELSQVELSEIDIKELREESKIKPITECTVSDKIKLKLSYMR